MQMLKKLEPIVARRVESFDQIKDDAFAMIDLLDNGIEKSDGMFASAAALHHAQLSATPFNFFVVADGYKDVFGGGRIKRIVINPKITHQADYVPFSEGCLSFLDHAHINTKRFYQVNLDYQYANLAGELKRHFGSAYLTGFPAFLVQHECDHGQGLNIYDGRFDEYNPRVELDKTQ